MNMLGGVLAGESSCGRHVGAMCHSQHSNAPVLSHANHGRELRHRVGRQRIRQHAFHDRDFIKSVPVREYEHLSGHLYRRGHCGRIEWDIRTGSTLISGRK